MMNYLFEMVERRKDVVRLISNRGNCRRLPPLQIFTTPRTTSELKQDLSFDFIK